MKALSKENFKNIIPKLERGSILMNYDLLKTDEYFIGVEEHIRNQFGKCSKKVISHVAMTKALFLMEYYSSFIDFTENKIFIEVEGQEYSIKCSNHDDLNYIMDNYIEWGDFEHPYEDYRNYTRKLLDHLDIYEDKPLKTIWNALIDMSTIYFSKSVLMDGYDLYLSENENE